MAEEREGRGWMVRILRVMNSAWEKQRKPGRDRGMGDKMEEEVDWMALRSSALGVGEMCPKARTCTSACRFARIHIIGLCRGIL